MTEYNYYDGIPDDEIWNIDYKELEFVKEIARGSFGKVFKGTYLGVDVAIKQILRHDDPAYMKYIEREISVLKGVRHPFIVNFSGVCVHQTGLYIVTEYVDGGDVRTLLKTGKVTWQRRVQLANDLAKAMYYLHSKKIIHRDLKSKNLLIGRDGRLRLCDFGFARISEFSGKTRAMTICGTPGFVAPEIMLGQEYDSLCDVFSFGNVMAELATLKRPGKEFWLRNPGDSYWLHFEEIKKFLEPETPPKFLDLCEKCCAYEPSQRPDFAYVCKVMKEIEDSLPKVSTTSSPPVSPRNAPPPNLGPLPGIPNQSTSIMSNHRNPDSKNGSAIVAKNSSTENKRHSLISLVTSKGAPTASNGSPNNNNNANSSPNPPRAQTQHLMKMIGRAASPDYADLEYVQDLLLTYPCFTTPPEFLSCIIQRFANPHDLDQTLLPGSQISSSDTQRQQKSQMRIIVLLNTWLEKFVNDFNEPGMKELMQQFDKLAATEMKEGAYSLEKNFAKCLQKYQEQKNSLPPVSIRGRGNLNPDPATLLNFTSTEMARQMTLIDGKLVPHIVTREFLRGVWKGIDDSPIKLLLDSNKNWTKFVASLIVSAPKKEGRVAVITKFVEIAQIAINLRSYNVVFGIVFGFKHPAVERLADTWKAVPNSVQSNLKTLRELTSADDHYVKYRERQESSSPPCVPYLLPYLEEISYIDSFNPDLTQGGIINFSKHRKIARMIYSLEQISKVSFTELKPMEKMLDWINGMILWDDEELQKNSYNCEKPSGF